MSDNSVQGSKPYGFLGKRGLTVQVYNNNVNKALSQLKKRCNTEGISKELRKRKHFEPETLKRRRRLAEAQGRWRKKRAQFDGLDSGRNRRS